LKGGFPSMPPIKADMSSMCLDVWDSWFKPVAYR
jgi:hypothetical protein